MIAIPLTAKTALAIQIVAGCAQVGAVVVLLLTTWHGQRKSRQINALRQAQIDAFHALMVNFGKEANSLLRTAENELRARRLLGPAPPPPPPPTVQ